MTLEFVKAGVAGLSRALSAKETTAMKATKAYLDRIAQFDDKINSFITVTADLALRQAEASDQRRTAGNSIGVLDGIPIALKDNIDLDGVVTTAGIGAFHNRKANADAWVTRQLKSAGAIILGKTNMHEAAHGATTANEVYGYCYNPHKAQHTPGGSSGGTGAAVASGLCAAGLGTDTLGSVRIPAALNGTAGIKTTYGCIDLEGVVPLAWSLDTIGPLARSVEDLSLLLAAMGVFKANYPITRNLIQKNKTLSDLLSTDLSSLILGRLTTLNVPGGIEVDENIEAAYEAALETLGKAGAIIKDVSWEGYDQNQVRPKALLIIESDLANIFSEELEKNPEGFTSIFRKGVEFGRAQDAPKLAKAYQTLRDVNVVASKIFTEVDALITPTTPCLAWPFSEEMPLTLTSFTAFANYIGAPSVSVPMGKTNTGLPMGLQITTPPWQDALALTIAHTYEQAAGTDMMPEGF